MTPDDNDIVYSQYTPDFLGLFRRAIEALSGSDITADRIMSFLFIAWDVFSVIAFILSALFIVGIIYSYIRMGQLSEVEAAAMEEEEKRWKERHKHDTENKRWAEIKKRVESVSPNDWKMAIIEADIMLGEVLANAGFVGVSIGDQLKSASASNIKTIQDAWDAHKVRNQIAHEGSDFILTQGMAQAALIKYERVFHEFGAL